MGFLKEKEMPQIHRLKKESVNLWHNFLIYSTVTDLAKFRGWSTLQPLKRAM